ncbi:hypothetical protein CC77DRAFT_54224 [Alternaria alternata]|jgi:hypothetical protein|uniref:Uncharacterized protein n=1 Tax=Alternaria alternata TaxID=5599 RepID=A0A177E4V7_ALTAL|nr:hypothetical protein CC77DRAFT_54224 [Alternaria alternata]OAG26511.1 hypothetical protein CC77DRAFT_54224 [Alternaria alternata]
MMSLGPLQDSNLRCQCPWESHRACGNIRVECSIALLAPVTAVLEWSVLHSTSINVIVGRDGTLCSCEDVRCVPSTNSHFAGTQSSIAVCNRYRTICTAIAQLEESSPGDMNASTSALPDKAAIQRASKSSTGAITGDRNFVYDDNAPSSQESSTSFNSLTEDFLYEIEGSICASPVDSSITLSSIELDSVDIGDVVVQANSVEWLVRICFCDSASCCGKTVARLESGERNLVRKSAWRKRVYAKDHVEDVEEDCIVQS